MAEGSRHDAHPLPPMAWRVAIPQWGFHSQPHLSLFFDRFPFVGPCHVLVVVAVGVVAIAVAAIVVVAIAVAAVVAKVAAAAVVARIVVVAAAGLDRLIYLRSPF